MPPFPFVRESLQKLQGKADIVVVSATPGETLVREWNEHDIARYVAVIAGQEMGTKDQQLQAATKGRYQENHVLMVGDAPGDLKAAKANNALFYPVNPGGEDESWRRFHNEALDRFFRGQYAGAYERKLIEEFDRRLPEKPPWIRVRKHEIRNRNKSEIQRLQTRCQDLHVIASEAISYRAG